MFPAENFKTQFFLVKTLQMSQNNNLRLDSAEERKAVFSQVHKL